MQRRQETLCRPDAGRGDVDLRAEIRPALPDRVSEAVEMQRRVLLRIAGDDVAATSAHELIDAKVLEMTAVGEIDERRAVVRQTEQLVEQIQQATARTRSEPRPVIAGIAH